MEAPQPIWTDERVEMLKRLWTDGMSASQVAAALGGVSRNAVIGKVHRLKLTKRVATATSPSSRPRVRQASSKQRDVIAPQRIARKTVGALAVQQLVIEEPRAAAFVEPEILAARGNVTLLELDSDTCRWPIGDPRLPGFRFCGAKAMEGSPYCGSHTQRAYPRSKIF